MYLPLMLSNFAAHTIIPAIMQEQTGTQLEKYQTTRNSVMLALIVGMVLFTVIGLCGSMSFGLNASDNILLSY